jgi:murein DD-endopeptidase MepM/ murein hydrolase activator NlpD
VHLQQLHGMVSKEAIMTKPHFITFVAILLLSAHAKGSIADSWQFPLVDRGWFDTANQRGYTFGQPVGGSYHLGEDLLRDYEAPVFACANGTVKYAQYVGYVSKGVKFQVPVVVIEHDLGGGVFVCSVYYHIQYSAYVAVGQSVSKGDQIGYVSLVASDHANTTPHLHFGIRSGSFSLDRESDGYWRYKGYGSLDILRLWFSPSQFISEMRMVLGKCLFATRATFRMVPFGCRTARGLFS